MPRRHRADDNQKELVAALRTLPGVTVAITSQVGDGFPDICVGYRGKNYLFEVKDPAKPPSQRKRKPSQVQWQSLWTGQVATVLEFKHVLREIGFGER